MRKVDICPGAKKPMTLDYDSEPEAVGRINSGMPLNGIQGRGGSMIRMLFVLIAVNSFVLVGLGGLIVWLAIETHDNKDDIREIQDERATAQNELNYVRGLVNTEQDRNVVLLDQPSAKGFAVVNPLYEGTGYWTSKTKMPFKRSDHQAVAVDDLVYIIGGLDTEENVTDRVTIYDTVLDTYKTGPRMPVPLHRYAVASIPGDEGMSNGKIYIIGGLKSADFEEQATDEVFVLDVKSGEWSEGPKLNTARSDFCGYAVNGTIYIAGGWSINFEKTLFEVEVLDPEEGKWTELPDGLPTARGDCKCGRIRDSFVVVGGFFDPLDQWRPTMFRKEVEAYNTTTGQWETLAPVPDPRGDMAVASLPGDRLLVIGGETHSRGERPEVATHEVNEYMSQHNSWVKKVPLPYARFRMDAVYVDGVVYVFGGHAICKQKDCPETDTVQAYFDIDHPDFFLGARS